VYNSAWKVFSILIPLDAVLFTTFLLFIDKRYVKTFFSTEKGKDMTIRAFRNGNEEQKASMIFTNSRRHWKAIEEEVRGWIEANWERWISERPSWLNDVVRAKIPLGERERGAK